MKPFEKIFGPGPRVRMVEALLRLSPGEFSRPEAAEEARVFKASANRVLSALERDGIIERTSSSPIVYRVRSDNRRMEILRLAEAALRLGERNKHDAPSMSAIMDLAADRFSMRTGAVRRISLTMDFGSVGEQPVTVSQGGNEPPQKVILVTPTPNGRSVRLEGAR